MTFRIAQISDTHLSEAKPFFVDNFVRIGEAPIDGAHAASGTSAPTGGGGRAQDAAIAELWRRGPAQPGAVPAQAPVPDGGHDSRLLRVPGGPNLPIEDFPLAHGPV
jgi:hypothetical protein